MRYTDQAEEFVKLLDNSGKSGIDASEKMSGISIKGRSEKQAIEYLRLINYLTGLARVHGLEKPFTIRMADASDIGYGWADGDKREIVLGTEIYEKAQEVYEVYSGAVIHEAEHLLSSQDMYRWLRTGIVNNVHYGDISERFKAIMNCIEDFRIEKRAVKRSRGFTEYLKKMQDFVFKKESDEIAQEWDKMSPYSKAFSIFVFIFRAPHRITDDMKNFERNNRNPYKEISSLSGTLEPFEAEFEVAEKIDKILNYFEETKNTKEQKRQAKNKKKGKKTKTGMGTPFSKDEKRMGQIEQELKEARKNYGNIMDEEEKVKAEKKIERLKGNLSKVVGEETVEKMCPGKKHEAGDVIGADIGVHLKSMTEQKFRIVDQNLIGRNVITMEPLVDERAEGVFGELKTSMSHYVQRMRKVFQLRLAESVKIQSERKRGSLHRRMLSRATLTDRLFCTRTVQKAVGLSICLLLDESGSMGSIDTCLNNQKISKALKSSYVLMEAISGIKNIDLHIYSHTTADNDCLIKKLYSPVLSEKERLATYCSGQSNFDGKAIEVVGKEFIKNCRQDKKLMIVLSDGQPWAFDKQEWSHGYAGEEETKKAVQGMERKGVEMVQIAIDSAKPETMFSNFVKFKDMSTLIKDMTNFVKNKIMSTGRKVYACNSR